MESGDVLIAMGESSGLRRLEETAQRQKLLRDHRNEDHQHG
jgi:uncharacterized protein with PhoU and TrkA domain